jgi:hypothetical protein
MKNVLLLATALVLGATQATAQQAQPAALSPDLAATPVQIAPEAQPAPAAQAAPSIHVSNQEIRRQVRLAEEQRSVQEVGSTDWLYLAGFIALGALVVLLLFD